MSAWCYVLAWAATLAAQLLQLPYAGQLAGLAILLFLLAEFRNQRRYAQALFLALLGIGMAGVAAAPHPVELFLDAWRRGASYAAFFLALTTLRDAAETSRLVRRCGRHLVAQPPGRRYAALTAGGHVFGIILSYGAIELLAAMVARANDADTATAAPTRALRARRMLMAIYRGFCVMNCWSPLNIMTAVVSTAVPAAPMPLLLPIAFVVSVGMAALGWLEDRLSAARRATRAPLSAPPFGTPPFRAPSGVPRPGAPSGTPLSSAPSGTPLSSAPSGTPLSSAPSGTPLSSAPSGATPPGTRSGATDPWSIHFRIIALVGLVMLLAEGLSRGARITLVTAVTLVVPSVAIAWLLVQLRHQQPRLILPMLGRRLARFRQRIPGFRAEATVLAASGFMAFALAGAFPAAGLAPLLAWLPPLALPLLVPVVLIASGQIGLNPVAVVALLGAAVPDPAALGVPPAVLAFAFMLSWGLGVGMTPMSASAITTARWAGVAPWTVSTVWNAAFTLSSLLLAWAAIAALFLLAPQVFASAPPAAG
jgi:hypothetical protein